MAVTVNTKAVAEFSWLASTGSPGGPQWQQPQTFNLRYCAGQMSSASCSCNSSAVSSSQWLYHNKRLEESGRGVMRRVAGVQAGTADEIQDRGAEMTIGRVAIQGMRDEMEDDIVVRDGPLEFKYVGVFDGHGGFAAAKYLREQLYEECVESLQAGKLLVSEDESAAKDALVHAFHAIDSRLLAWLESESTEKDSGSTATVAFIRNDSITIANVGDSRSVLSRGGKAVDLSGDHRPFGNTRTAIAEINRIRTAGGWVNHGRLCSMLSVSRAFGNVQFKTKKGQMIEEGIKNRRWTRAFTERFNLDGVWLSVTPEVTRVPLDEDAEFIIVASDGLWDSFKSKDAVQFVRKQLQEHGNVQQAAEAIAQATLDRHGQDNVSVIILDMGRVPRSEGGINLKFW